MAQQTLFTKLTAFLLILIGNSFAQAHLPVVIEERLVSVHDVRPTQMEVGKAHVEYSRVKIYKNPNLIESMASRALPAWIGPDKKIYITDGHHWASGSQLVYDENPKLANELKLRVQIEADFSQKTWEEFYIALFNSGKGYFTPEVRHRYLSQDSSGKLFGTPENIVAMYQNHLPKSLPELQNNPWRSVFGMALEEIGFDPNFDFIDYIEFYIAEEFTEHMRTVSAIFADVDSGGKVTDKHVELTEEEIAKNPPILDFILHHLRPEADPSQLREKIYSVVNTFRHKLQLPDLFDESKPSTLPSVLRCQESLNKVSAGILTPTEH